MLTNFKVLRAVTWHEKYNIVYRKMQYKFVEAINEFRHIVFFLYANCIFYY